MPKKRSYGFVFSQFRSRTQIAQVITHEIGHGLFRLEHSFETYPSLAKGSTDNLMDYQEGNRLHKYQWDLIHNPIAMLGWFQDEGESAYYSVKEVQDLIEEIKKNNATTNTKLQTSRAIVTATDLKDEAWLKANMQNSWLPANLIQQLATDKHIRAELEKKPGIYEHIPISVANINPATDQHAVLLAKEVEVILGEQTMPVTIHGYAATDQIFTHYVAQQEVADNSTITFFNYEKPKSNVQNTKGLTDVSNIRKAFAITTATNNIQTLKNYLEIKGTIDWNSPENADQMDDIIIEVIRTKSNEFITTGEISVRGTDIRGATLELGKGTMAEECTSCPDNTHHGCKRIPAGTYNFELNTTTTSGKGQHVYHSIRLTNTNGRLINGHKSERDGVLIHRGNSYSFIQGCILAMYHEKLPSVLEDVDAYLNRDIMGYNVTEEERTILPILIYEYISRVDPEGTKKKTVIISNKDEGNPLAINTEKFEKRKRAGEYYISLNVAQKTENIIEDLTYEITKSLLSNEGITKVMNEKKLALSLNLTLSEEEKQKVLEDTWNILMKKKDSNITAKNSISLIGSYNERFLQLVKERIITDLQKEGVAESESEEIWHYMSDKKYGGSSPGSPFDRQFLGIKDNEWQKAEKAAIIKLFSSNINKLMEEFTIY